jgi:N-acetyltransferase
MRTYSRNVRRAWDGDDYRPPKRLRLHDTWNASSTAAPALNENALNPLDLEDSLERAIRETSVAAMSSSPSRKNSTIFSAAESQDDDVGSSTITPPSSPPPELQITPPKVKARKPTFSFLNKSNKDKKDHKNAKRKRDGQSSGPGEERRSDSSEPLMEILNSSTRAQSSQPSTSDAPSQQDPNTTPVARPTLQIPSQAAPPKQKLVQTILDLGQPLLPTTCSQCQMSYTPSLPEDVQLHNMYHNRDSAGIELGKAFLKSAMRWCYQVPQIPGSVIVVDRKMAHPSRRVVQKVLGIVNKELGSVDIKEDELWSQRVPEGEKDEESGGKKADRYKAFLHIIDEKCVGICLAERISKAHRVLPRETANSESLPLNGHFGLNRPASPAPTEANEEDQHHKVSQQPQIPTPVASPTSASPSSSITISEETYPAVVGVSRIWTSKAFRHKGIANNLLECVMNQFIYGLELEPLQLAFSQPTEGGAALARNWFGEQHGWAVYRED